MGYSCFNEYTFILYIFIILIMIKGSLNRHALFKEISFIFLLCLFLFKMLRGKRRNVCAIYAKASHSFQSAGTFPKGNETEAQEI